MDCLYPDKSPGRAHRLGCRCDRCRSYDSAYRMKWKENPENRQKDRDATKRYEKTPDGRSKKASRKAARRVKVSSQKKTLTPEELDRIYEIYKNCRMLTETTGIRHHVDHIIPIAKGGQHHPDNLQILTAEENLRKGSRILLDGVQENCQDFKEDCQ